MSGNFHERYVRFETERCEVGCPETDSFIIFKKDSKLRRHMVKHYLNTNEEWHRNLNDLESTKGIRDLVVLVSNELRELGCPYIRKTCVDEPPCEICIFYNSCTDILEKAEMKYTEAVEELLSVVLSLPRYACYMNKREMEKTIVGVHRRAKVLASLIGFGEEDIVYNVRTAHININFRRPGDVMRDVVRKAKIEGGKTVIWCNKMNWGIEPNNEKDF